MHLLPKFLTHNSRASRQVYLDNNATTRPHEWLVQYIAKMDKTVYANASSGHSMGKYAHNILEWSKREIGRCLKIDHPQSELLFTSGATESNNMLIQGFVDKQYETFSSVPNHQGVRCHLIMTCIEHPSVSETCKTMALKYPGKVKLHEIPVHPMTGLLNLNALQQVLNDIANKPPSSSKHLPRILICVIQANNEIGTIQDMQAIHNIVRRQGLRSRTHIHADATQMAGKWPCSVSHIDSLSFSGHKFHAVKGVGGLYVKSQKTRHIAPRVFGGMQEKLRSGTLALPLILSMALAMQYNLHSERVKVTLQKMHGNEQLLLNALRSNGVSFRTNGPRAPTANHAPPPQNWLRMPGSMSLTLLLPISVSSSLKPSQLRDYLDKRGILVTTGSACNHSAESHVLKAMGVSKLEQRTTIRVGQSFLTSQVDMIRLAKAISDFVKRVSN